MTDPRIEAARQWYRSTHNGAECSYVAIGFLLDDLDKLDSARPEPIPDGLREAAAARHREVISTNGIGDPFSHAEVDAAVTLARQLKGYHDMTIPTQNAAVAGVALGLRGALSAPSVNAEPNDARVAAAIPSPELDAEVVSHVAKSRAYLAETETAVRDQESASELLHLIGHADEELRRLEALRSRPPVKQEPLSLDAGNDTPWPVRECLSRLAWAADHLLLAPHNCDCHGHEVTRHAVNAALRLLAEEPAKQEPAQEVVERVAKVIPSVYEGPTMPLYTEMARAAIQAMGEATRTGEALGMARELYGLLTSAAQRAECRRLVALLERETAGGK